MQASVEWAVAGLSPKVHAIAAGKLPRGAIVSGKRYSICPAKGSTGTYLFQLSATSRRLTIPHDFEPLKLFEQAESSTVGSGTLSAIYRRV